MGNPVLKPWDCYYVPLINNINYKLPEMAQNGILIVINFVKTITQCTFR